MSDLPSREPFRERFRRFFHYEELPYGLALVRIVLPLVLLTTVIVRWPHAREIYSTDGVTTPMTAGYGYPDIFPIFPGAVAVGLLTLQMASLAALAAGWRTRTSLAISFVLYVYFTQIDGIGTMTKFSVVSTHVFLLMMFSNCGDVLSVDAWLRKRGANGDAPPPQPSPIWPRRLVQILVGVIYFATAMTKLRSPDFFTGERMTSWLLGNVTYSHAMGKLTAMYPVIPIISAYVTVVWEILFLFLAWRGAGRVWMLSIGLVFHVGTYFMLGLATFPFIFLSLYFTFFSQAEYERLGRTLLAWKKRLFGARSGAAPSSHRHRPQRGFPSGAVYGCALLAIILVGIEAEYLLDPYQMRGPNGPLELTAVEPELARRMIADDRLIREKDKFFSFDIGTSLLGGALANRRTEFEYGETVIAQCVFNPPHDDLWVECNMYDPEGRLILRNNDLAIREVVRMNFHFRLDAKIAPGEYSLVLKSQGSEIARRKFHLSGSPQQAKSLSPVAN